MIDDSTWQSWTSMWLIGRSGNGSFEIIEFVHGARMPGFTVCMALDGTIVNSPEIRQAPLTWAPVMCDSTWAL